MNEKHNHPGSGLFITFEGPDGAGKSTQLALTAQYLRSRNIAVVTSREPGGTPLAEQLRAILKGSPTQEPLAASTELLLMEAARAQHVAQVILPALQAGKAVLCDRFFDSTSAYQGAARHISKELIAELNNLACAGCRPDLTLMLDLAPEVGFRRNALREETLGVTDRFEEENFDFHREVREGFLFIASSEPERVRIIDAAQETAQVQQQIREVLDEFIQ